jgi:hypothetical protein
MLETAHDRRRRRRPGQTVRGHDGCPPPTRARGRRVDYDAIVIGSGVGGGDRITTSIVTRKITP